MEFKPFQRVVLVVADGLGVSLRTQGNAIAAAKTPALSYIEKHYPFTTLKASGISVGLSWLEPGNSEVGHMTMGTGRITYQYLPRIIQAIRDGTFFKNKALVGAAEHVIKNNSKLHILGLLGTGSVHSYIDHLYALLDLAQRQKIADRTYLHIYTDGKDSLPQEGAKFIEGLSERLEKTKAGQIATVVGRYYSMDRDNNWDRTEKAYRLFVGGEGKKAADPVKAVTEAYGEGLNDTFVPPTIITNAAGQPKGLIGDNDAVIFFDYREDSERQMVKCFAQGAKVGFELKNAPKNLFLATMTHYEDGLNANVAFQPPQIINCLAEVLAKAAKRQLHIAETEKYAHVTYFFNGSIEKLFEGESRELVPTAEVKSFDELPEMRTPEVAEKLLKAMEKGEHQFLIVNFANTDLVAHSGDFNATVKAVESVDAALKKIIYVVEQDENTALLVTGDHGKCEAMLDPYTGEHLTGHSTNNVPFYLIANRFRRENTSIDIFRMKRTSSGLLSDIAPTILELMGLAIPPEMTGHSLLSDLNVMS